MKIIGKSVGVEEEDWDKLHQFIQERFGSGDLATANGLPASLSREWYTDLASDTDRPGTAEGRKDPHGTRKS
jgi:fructose-1-phosphate kinase PfkB-like protein